ncbi:helicase [Metarhizium acridum]|nr:helicase [Metarhizium acridum]
MSATLDASTFMDYFATEGLSVGCVEIAGRTFPVDEYYLDDVIRITGFSVEKPDAGFIKDESMGKIIQKLGHRINYTLLVDAVKAIDYELSYEKKPDGILIFLPGVGEINHACNLCDLSTRCMSAAACVTGDSRAEKSIFQASSRKAQGCSSY